MATFTVEEEVQECEESFQDWTIVDNNDEMCQFSDLHNLILLLL